MKLHFNLANWAQSSVGLTITTEDFLRNESNSKLAMVAAISDSIYCNGPGSPVWPHIESLCRDYGQLPEQDDKAFEILLKAYWAKLFPVFDKPAAQLVWAEIDRRFTDLTGDKAFRRLFERAACEHYNRKSIDQDGVDEFQELLKTESVEWI